MGENLMEENFMEESFIQGGIGASRRMSQAEFERAATEYREKKVLADAASAALTAVAGRLKAEMEARGVEKAKAGILEVRYQNIKSPRFDVKAFKLDEPGLFERYYIDTYSRRFSVA